MSSLKQLLSVLSLGLIVILPAVNIANSQDDSGQMLNYGDAVCDQFLSNGNGQQWNFWGEAGDRIAISMSSNSFDSYLELIGPRGDTVAEDDDSGGNRNANLAYELSESGPYTIVARSYSKANTGSYTLDLTQDNRLTYGSSVRREISNSAGNQWFFEGNADDVITLAMFSSDVDSYLELTNPDGMRVMQDDDSGGGTDALIEDYQLTESGQYSVIARDFSQSNTGVYVLSLRVDNPSPGSFLNYGSVIDVQITNSAQTWRFLGERGHRVTISMNSDEVDFDSYLELTDPSGTLVAFDDDSGGRPDALIDGYELQDGGQYTIRARNLSGTSGRYALSLEGLRCISPR